jgi:hypothetical protein
VQKLGQYNSKFPYTAGLISIHGHSLRVSAQFAVCGWADWPAARVSNGAAFLECEKLLSTEALVVDLRCRLNQVLEVSAGEEVAEIDEFAVVLVLDFGKVSIARLCIMSVHVPFTTPQRFCRPRTCLPATTMVFSEPTTANGIMLWLELVSAKCMASK